MDNQTMGIGALGFENTKFKRKFRFTFEIQDVCGNKNIPPGFVKTAARPSLTIEETEINWMHGKKWIPGKPAWEPITITYIDAHNPDDQDYQNVYSWLTTLYNVFERISTPQTKHRMASTGSDYAGTGILKLLDGCGGVMEEWELYDVWPTTVNFGEVDYGSSDECTIELSLRYSDVKYTQYCPDALIIGCCETC